ncbi:MAG: hypothetical protein K8R92_09070 [Planctomycetes bacterium]|nr:hypothetical protein [Planctomycetota bacterium]
MKPFAAAIAFLLLMLCPMAHGIGGDHRPGANIAVPGAWPPRLVELAKHPSRFAGYFVNTDDYLAFRGDTAGFQACLDTCVALNKFAATTVHVHKGKGAFQPFDPSLAPLACDWKLDVINLLFHAAPIRPSEPNYKLVLHVWTGGSINLAAIQVPPAMKVVQDC